MDAVLNCRLHSFHMQNDELGAAKVSCAQIGVLCVSLTAQKERVRLAEAEANRVWEKTQELPEESWALRRERSDMVIDFSDVRRWKRDRYGVSNWEEPGDEYERGGESRWLP